MPPRAVGAGVAHRQDQPVVVGRRDFGQLPPPSLLIARRQSAAEHRTLQPLPVALQQHRDLPEAPVVADVVTDEVLATGG
jgi:hypothetical protein